MGKKLQTNKLEKKKELLLKKKILKMNPPIFTFPKISFFIFEP